MFVISTEASHAPDGGLAKSIPWSGGMDVADSRGSYARFLAAAVTSRADVHHQWAGALELIEFEEVVAESFVMKETNFAHNSWHNFFARLPFDMTCSYLAKIFPNCL